MLVAPSLLCWVWTGDHATTLLIVGQSLPKWLSLPQLLRTNTPHVWSSTLVALDPARWRRKPSRPLRLGVSPSIRFLLFLRSRLGPRWSSNFLLLLVLSFHLYLHSIHDSSLLHQLRKVFDGKWGHHQTNVSFETILKLLASPLLIKWHGVEALEVLEHLCIFSYQLVPLGQLEELHLLSVSHAIREVLRQKLPLECLPSDLLMLLLHD